MEKRVLLTDYVWPSVEPERIVLQNAGVELVVAPDSEEDTLVSLSKDIDGILTCFAQITGSILRSASQCVVVGRCGVGVDNIDVGVATELGIAVTYVPDYCVDEVSDHVMALMHTWNRRIITFDRSVRENGWGTLPLTMRIMRLRGKKFGVIGFGRIGQAVSSKARAFGLNVLTYDPYLSQSEGSRAGAEVVDLQTLLKESDFVSLHCPLTAETRHLIGKPELNIMKRDAFLINAARGPLVDEEALYQALKNGQIAGAGVDVLTESSPPNDHPLFQLQNLIITPHVAFFSQESTLELEHRAAREVIRVLNNDMPENLVNPQVINHSRANLNRK
ncbi:C-terminal binding protein [SAR202 cluster bacterium AD-804-J14_MRT_500m]|nr:C-terminal binding protein [SAR202 cluster bacterium AD-804-J14_MRT_500m]